MLLSIKCSRKENIDFEKMDSLITPRNIYNIYILIEFKNKSHPEKNKLLNDKEHVTSLLEIEKRKLKVT